MVLCAVTACGGARPVVLPQPPAEPIRDTAIVPGVRIGPFALGMTSKQLAAAMGTPDEERDNGEWLVWGSVSVKVDVNDPERRVVRVSLRDESYATADGVRLGETAFIVRTKLGVPSKPDHPGNPPGISTLDYCRVGIVVETQNSKVYVISVFPPGC
jgi:hypothetical protein